MNAQNQQTERLKAAAEPNRTKLEGRLAVLTENIISNLFSSV
jgi:hypothetical protein